MSNDLYIRGMAKGTNKRFNKTLKMVAELLPLNAPHVWIGVAVHIVCTQNGKGTAEYIKIPVRPEWGVVWPLDEHLVCTIRPKTVKDKFTRYMNEVLKNA